jgi:3-isopropylmalate/(R)-2-methylmalate dehydratase large subunit
LEIQEFDVAEIPLQVSFPHSPENAKSVKEASGIKIDQVVIGSCTNGRLEDLRSAAEILRGKKVHPEIRCLVFPGTQTILRDAMREGIIDTLIEAGAAVSTPTCGPCLGGHMGILAKGERAVSTTNRNFVGRMGHVESEVYLAGPAVAAASAIKGQIAHPEEVS